MTGKEEKA